MLVDGLSAAIMIKIVLNDGGGGFALQKQHEKSGVLHLAFMFVVVGNAGWLKLLVDDVLIVSGNGTVICTCLLIPHHQ